MPLFVANSAIAASLTSVNASVFSTSSQNAAWSGCFSMQRTSSGMQPSSASFAHTVLSSHAFRKKATAFVCTGSSCA